MKNRKDSAGYPRHVGTLRDFYRVMNATREVRRRIVRRYLDDPASVPSAEVELLRRGADLLASIPRSGGKAVVDIEPGTGIALDLAYEEGELRKDLIFLRRGEQALRDRLAELHEGFSGEVAACVDFLMEARPAVFVSDRDGTVNNYCGRYRSSVQSAYNAVFLSRFARRCVRRAVILTSAPLADVGLVDISTAPDDLFIYAGSKGREYRDCSGATGSFPIDTGRQARLDELNARIEELLRGREYEKFGYIGSGFQRKFGQSTIARQDIGASVPEAASRAFLEKIRGVVSSVDPEERFFRIEDTGLDIEIILTVDSGGAVRDFDKGDGVRFLDSALGLGMREGPNLVCGDTPSDVPMAAKSCEMCGDTRVVFVTRDDALAGRIRAACPAVHIVGRPDVLVTALEACSRTAYPNA